MHYGARVIRDLLFYFLSVEVAIRISKRVRRNGGTESRKMRDNIHLIQTKGFVQKRNDLDLLVSWQQREIKEGTLFQGIIQAFSCLGTSRVGIDCYNSSRQ